MINYNFEGAWVFLCSFFFFFFFLLSCCCCCCCCCFSFERKSAHNYLPWEIFKEQRSILFLFFRRSMVVLRRPQLDGGVNAFDNLHQVLSFCSPAPADFCKTWLIEVRAVSVLPCLGSVQNTKSTHKGVNQSSKYVTQVLQQRPESPTVTLIWHACKYKQVHKLHQRYVLLYKTQPQKSC